MAARILALVVLSFWTALAIAGGPFQGTWVRCFNNTRTACSDGPAVGWVIEQYNQNICGISFERGRHTNGGRIVGKVENKTAVFRGCEDMQWVCTAQKWSAPIRAERRGKELHVTVQIQGGGTEKERTTVYYLSSWSEPLSAWTTQEFATACEERSNRLLQLGPAQAPAGEQGR